MPKKKTAKKKAAKKNTRKRPAKKAVKKTTRRKVNRAVVTTKAAKPEPVAPFYAAGPKGDDDRTQEGAVPDPGGLLSEERRNRQR